MVVALIGSMLVVQGPAQAGCTSSNRGGSAGPYDTAGVVYGDLEISAWTYGNFATGPAFVCSDGTYGADSPRGSFVVKSDGEANGAAVVDRYML